ncbi:Arm DNA-binding domain-containing protein [Deferribacter abyssi]|uniref:Arm DNA-binding domain-containing protein n=1 Tax=Deferribacter abyssi TaxID=213806 RepID=UPI003C19DB3E
MPMGVYARNGILWLNFTYKGIRCYESLGITDTKTNRKYAERLLSEIKNKIALDIFNYADYFPESKRLELFGFKKSQPKKLYEVANEFTASKENKYKAGLLSYSTIKNTKKELKDFIAHFGQYQIDKIKPIDIEQWITEFAQGRKPKTVNNAISTIKLLFKYAEAKEYISNNPTVHIKHLKQPKPDIEPFTREEMITILEYFKKQYPHLYPLLAFLFFTGCRTGEALAAKWENLDTNNWTYYIKESFSNHRLSGTKTIYSTRVIDIIPLLQEILKSHKAATFMKSEFMFLNKDGKPYTSSKSIVQYYWRPALKRLGIRYRQLYQTRHTYAVLSLIAGENPHYVAKQMGHSNMQMLFQRYARYIENFRPETSRFANFVTISLHSKNQNSQLIDIKDKSK